MLTGILANKTYNHLQYNNIIPIEQKGGQRNCRGAKDHLLINKTILYTCRQHQRNLHMAWIDYRKAYDMLPHSWILHTLRTYGVANNTHTFVKNIMTKWQTEMFFNKTALGNVKINRGISQGDSLSPLLFVIALVPLTTILNSLKSGYKIPQTQTKINHLLYMDDLKLYTNTQKQLTSMLNTVNTFTKDIKMEFGLNKCGTVAIHKGTSMDEAVHNLMDGNSLPLVGKDGYKYLGIFENITIMQSHTTTTIERTYKHRLKKILKSKLNARNCIKAINTWALPVIRYTAGIINWTEQQIKTLDTNTRKLLTIYGVHHPKADVARLYVRRQEGGRGLGSVRQTIRNEEHAIAYYLNNQQDSLSQSIKQHLKLRTPKQNKQQSDEHQKELISQWEEKPLHGQYRKIICENPTHTNNWLRTSDLKKETEGFIIAAQDQALTTNFMKAAIHKTRSCAKCRMCAEKDETVFHIVSECSKLAQKQYKHRHDSVCKHVHWLLCMQG